MRTPDEIRNFDFSKSPMGGYKAQEVEQFLEEVAAEIETIARQKIDGDKKIAEMSRKAQDAMPAESIQNVLVSAQRVADQLVEDANQKAAAILSSADETASKMNFKAEAILKETEQRAIVLKETTDAQAAKILAQAVEKSESMIAAAHDSVARQQLNFDKLRTEVAAFKKNIISKYKSQIELIAQIPDEVPFDAKRASEALAFQYDKVPDFEKIVSETKNNDQIITEKAAEPIVIENPVVIEAERPIIIEEKPVIEQKPVIEEKPIENNDNSQKEQYAVLRPGIRFGEEEDIDDEPQQRGFFKKRNKQ